MADTTIPVNNPTALHDCRTLLARITLRQCAVNRQHKLSACMGCGGLSRSMTIDLPPDLSDLLTYHGIDVEQVVELLRLTVTGRLRYRAPMPRR